MAELAAHHKMIYDALLLIGKSAIVNNLIEEEDIKSFSIYLTSLRVEYIMTNSITKLVSDYKRSIK